MEKTRDPSASRPVESEREHLGSTSSRCLHCLLLQQSLVLPYLFPLPVVLPLLSLAFLSLTKLLPLSTLIYSFLSLQLPPCPTSYSVPTFPLPYSHPVLLGHKPISLKYSVPWCSGLAIGYDVHLLLGFPERSHLPQWKTQPD